MVFTERFGKKKTLSGQDIPSLFNALATWRDPIIISSQAFRFTSEVLEVRDGVFNLRNTLSRDEVMYNLKGYPLQVQVPYELTLYRGSTILTGLGMVKKMHTLKFRLPEHLKQDESRTAYRVSSFPGSPFVTFTTNDLQLVRAQLADISMTGAGVRPDIKWNMANAGVLVGSKVQVEIKIGEEVKINTNAEVRHGDNRKVGMLFDSLKKEEKARLFKFIVKQRKIEQRKAIPPEPKAFHDLPFEDETSSGTTPMKTSTRPTVLIAGDNQELSDFLQTTLNRKFDVLQCPFAVTDIRNNLELQPALCLLELKSGDMAQVSQAKKVGTLIPPQSVLMFYGEGFTPEFRERFRGPGDPNEILVDVKTRSKLLTFKSIEKYFSHKAVL